MICIIGNIGMSELLIIAGVALVVLGPEKFPEYAKIALRAWRDLRGYVDEVKREVGKELKPLNEEMRKLSRVDPEKYIDSLMKEDAPKAQSVVQEDPKTVPARQNVVEPPAETQAPVTNTESPPVDGEQQFEGYRVEDFNRD